MFVIPLDGVSELVLLGLVERAEAVLHAQAEGLSETNRRLELEYCQYIKFSNTTKPIRDERHRTVGINQTPNS
jgi:hypothetical protein